MVRRVPRPPADGAATRRVHQQARDRRTRAQPREAGRVPQGERRAGGPGALALARWVIRRHPGKAGGDRPARRGARGGVQAARRPHERLQSGAHGEGQHSGSRRDGHRAREAGVQRVRVQVLLRHRRDAGPVLPEHPPHWHGRERGDQRPDVQLPPRRGQAVLPVDGQARPRGGEPGRSARTVEREGGPPARPPRARRRRTPHPPDDDGQRAEPGPDDGSGALTALPGRDGNRPSVERTPHPHGPLVRPEPGRADRYRHGGQQQEPKRRHAPDPPRTGDGHPRAPVG